jgi:enamine deaminase RidA (YjgF/YER057c/UK114 family)
MGIERVHPPSLFVAKYDGTPVFAQVVAVDAPVRWVHTAGQVSTDAAGTVIGRGDVRAQYIQIMENLAHCLAAVGGSLSDIIKTTAFVVDINDYRKVGDLRAKYFGAYPPASSTVQVSGLANPEFLVEIEAVAAIKASTP